MSFPGSAPHMRAMSILSQPHVRREPTQYRVTVMETPDDEHYYGRTYDCYPNEDGTVTISRGLGYDSVRVPFMGMHLVEELGQNGQPNGSFELLTFEEYHEQFVERGDPNCIYGFRSVGGTDIRIGPGTLESARDGVKVLQAKYPLGKFEVVSLRRDDGDGTWTVVGR